MSNNLHDLLTALAGTPALPGARCRGKPHLFDPRGDNEAPEVVAQRHLQATGLCSHCPSLDRCEDWLDALPKNQRPVGVVAGRINQPAYRGRPRKETA